MTAVLLRPELASAWQTVLRTAGGFREQCWELHQQVDDLLAEADSLRGQLEAKGRELRETRVQLAERGRQFVQQRDEASRLTQRLEQQDLRLEELLRELRSLREQLAADADRHQRQLAEERQAFADREAELRSQFEMQLAALLAELSASRASVEPVGAERTDDMTGELAQLREQLEATHAELIQALQQRPPESPLPLVAAEADQELVSRLEELEQERVALEAELGLVRARATELHLTVSQQRQELEQDRAQLGDELRQLRQCFEQQSRQWLERPQAQEPRETPPPVANAPAAAPVDPVVSSVMAQFAKLQKDVASRRKKT